MSTFTDAKVAQAVQESMRRIWIVADQVFHRWSEKEFSLLNHCLTYNIIDDAHVRQLLHDVIMQTGMGSALELTGQIKQWAEHTCNPRCLAYYRKCMTDIGEKQLPLRLEGGETEFEFIAWMKIDKLIADLYRELTTRPAPPLVWQDTHERRCADGGPCTC